METFSDDPEYSTVNFENVTNVTSSQKTQLLLYDILIPTLGVLAIILNGIVVISSGLILKKGAEPRATYLLLGNVAMTDLIASIAVMFGQLFPNEYRDHYTCSFQIGMIVSSTLASVYSVGLIAIDRFLYIILGAQKIHSICARILILLTWIIGCIIGFLPLMGWCGDTNNGQKCWFVLIAPKGLTLLTICAGMIPLLTILILYSLILYHAIRKINQLKGAAIPENETNPAGFKETSFYHKLFPETPSANPINNATKWKAIKIVSFTTECFIFTWCPYFIVSLMYTFCDDPDDPYCKTLMVLLASPLAILGFCNGLINPIIYAWWHRDFRTFIASKIKSCRKKKSKDTSSSN